MECPDCSDLFVFVSVNENACVTPPLVSVLHLEGRPRTGYGLTPAAGLLQPCGTVWAMATPEHPNVLLVMSDEHAPQYSSVYGHPLVVRASVIRSLHFLPAH